MKNNTINTSAEADAGTMITCAIIGALGVALGAVLPTVAAHFLPPKLGVSQAEKEPVSAKPEATGWKFKPFDGGDLAASELSLPNEQPLPKDIYAAVVGGREIWVWWKPSHSGFTYRYAYVAWDKNNPTNVPLPAMSATQAPIGLGGRKDDLFLFFNGTKSK